MTAAEPQVSLAARRISHAAATLAACAPVRDLLGDRDVGAAYQVQALLIEERLRSGSTRIGRKIGLTNRQVQRQLGVDQPDFGVLLDDMLCPSVRPVDSGRLLQPKIEAEIAYVLSADLDRPGITGSDVLAATEHVLAALEIVDSRVADWDISIVDTVADNASCGLFVLSDRPVPPPEVDLASVTMTMRQDGVTVSTGTGADCLGSPLEAVACSPEPSGTTAPRSGPARSCYPARSGRWCRSAPVLGTTPTCRRSVASRPRSTNFRPRGEPADAT